MLSYAAPQRLSKIHVALLFFAALLIRFLFFFSYVQYEERYQQPDSMDYHNCTLSLYWGAGMHRPDNQEPIFWRTPGYPIFLVPFYNYYHTPNRHYPPKTAFKDWTDSHVAIIIVQIILCSLIPILVWFLAYLLTSSALIASISAWITVFHIGFILASMYILTEGISVIFFLAFLYFLYAALRNKNNVKKIILAALFLGVYTWMRPMGQFVAVVSMLLMLFTSRETWSNRTKQIALFALIFFGSIAPWYIRNHDLTGLWFFCPMSGPYLNSFCAPKILRELNKSSLEQNIRILYTLAGQMHDKMKQIMQGTGYVVPREIACNAIALPIVMQHPFIFGKYWIIEVIKSTFDLYSYQLVALATNTFKYDPLEEFLWDKLAACLYAAHIPWWMRIIVYIELVYEILLWIGLVAGIFMFIFWPFFLHLRKKFCADALLQQERLWWRVLPMIIAVVGMTGGFGYARLRLPVEALMIILSLSWWLPMKYSKIHIGSDKIF